jgi:uncharacterized protein YsxB (DUF464 family)
MKNRGTTVTFVKRSDGALIGYRALGHSGYAASGEDIVCAGISALTQSTLNGLQNVLKAPVVSNIDARTASIEAILTPEATEDQIERAQLLLETLLQGLQAIERSYPRNIRIFFEERR